MRSPAAFLGDKGVGVQLKRRLCLTASSSPCTPSPCKFPCMRPRAGSPQAALEQGLQFGLSSNGVLLCEGPVPVSLVTRVERAQLPSEWQAAAPPTKKAKADDAAPR
jgi:hypothetical protein